jgi:carboxyl-terminal processing protease
LAVVVCGLICCRVPEQRVSVEVPEAKLSDPNIVKAICGLIYQGRFEDAGELIKAAKGTVQEELNTKGEALYAENQLDRLEQIVEEYGDVCQRRQSAREAAYREQLAELEKFRVAADTNEVNDVNDILKVLTVIAKAGEFADEQQKAQLLSDSFVKQIFQKAMDKAAEFESEGKWSDAYISCYSWLQAIDEDNKAYSDYADQLYEKANIAASFRDSPCESREERYAGVKKEMFVRAIDALNYSYVSIIDYRQMASKAIRHCRMLAEVISSSKEVREALYGSRYSEQTEEYDKKLAAWSAALTGILDEVDKSPVGVSKDKFIDIFEKVLALNVTTAELPEAVLITEFSQAAFSELDPYTIMVWPQQVADFEKEMTKEFTGIGIEIFKQKGMLTVVSLLPDTPAYKSGLDAGDVIELVDGVETKDMSLICAVKSITGPAGTDVTLTINRPGEDGRRDITITRAKIVVPPIRGWQRTTSGDWIYMIDTREKIGYVRITSFDTRTSSDLEKILTELESEGLRGLILDLRFNPGGLLESAVEVADKFLKEGLIVSTRPRFGVWTYAQARKEGTHPDYPVVILINRFTASGSEIVAGALADAQYNRAILVGERTHGKGVVQGITHHPGGGAQLKYTMAYYHLPSGQRVESREAMEKQGRKDWGVGPGIEVELKSDEYRKMSEVQRDNDVLVKADHDSGAAPLMKYTVEETLAADSQLSIGILIVKSKLIEMQSAKSVTANGSSGSRQEKI